MVIEIMPQSQIHMINFKHSKRNSP